MSTCVKTSNYRSRLLAGRARIHIDFHADRHFDDLWGLPGHLALLVNRTNSALLDKLLRNENFASEIFCHQPRKPRCFYAAVQNEFTDLCGFPVKPMWDQWVQSYPHQSGC
jgi:hypothetical protein